MGCLCLLLCLLRVCESREEVRENQLDLCFSIDHLDIILESLDQLIKELGTIGDLGKAQMRLN